MTRDLQILGFGALSVDDILYVDRPLKDDATFWGVPAYKVRAVDATGAGDCFHGAYAVALTDGEPPIACALYATAAAAIAITGHGGRMALPDHSACIARMAGDDAPVPAPISPPN